NTKSLLYSLLTHTHTHSPHTHPHTPHTHTHTHTHTHSSHTHTHTHTHTQTSTYILSLEKTGVFFQQNIDYILYTVFVPHKYISKRNTLSFKVTMCLNIKTH